MPDQPSVRKAVYDEDGYEWCSDFDAHNAANAMEFCESHQSAWCRLCSKQCPSCVDDPRCPDCGCSLFTDYHDWDCLYDEDEP